MLLVTRVDYSGALIIDDTRIGEENGHIFKRQNDIVQSKAVPNE